jgi:hypothetical protein
MMYILYPPKALSQSVCYSDPVSNDWQSLLMGILIYMDIKYMSLDVLSIFMDIYKYLC